MANVMIEQDLCKGCGLCVSACHLKVLKLDPNRLNRKGFNPASVVLEDQCVGCANCAVICPDSVITVMK